MALRKLTTQIFHGSIKDGKLTLNNERYFKMMLQGIEDTKNVRIILEKQTGSKTRRQLGYYFGVVLPEISSHTGYTVAELDAIFKTKYLKKKVMWRGGELAIIDSKANLTSDEMGEFMSSVILEAMELGVVVPEADADWVVKEQIKNGF